jgi:hypothetical protein
MGHQRHINQRNVKGTAENPETKGRRNINNIQNI